MGKYGQDPGLDIWWSQQTRMGHDNLKDTMTENISKTDTKKLVGQTQRKTLTGTEEKVKFTNTPGLNQ
jgi:hypothetical protein